MNTFKPNDKVVCIDATPIPIGAPNNSYQDFEYIQEGTVYCVRSVIMGRCGGESLDIVGPQVFLYGKPVPWNGLRFRKVERKKQRNKKAASQKLKTPHEQPTTKNAAPRPTSTQTSNSNCHAVVTTEPPPLTTSEHMLNRKTPGRVLDQHHLPLERRLPFPVSLVSVKRGKH
jgi:hypothetical protein